MICFIVIERSAWGRLLRTRLCQVQKKCQCQDVLLTPLYSSVLCYLVFTVALHKWFEAASIRYSMLIYFYLQHGSIQNVQCSDMPPRHPVDSSTSPPLSPWSHPICFRRASNAASQTNSDAPRQMGLAMLCWLAMRPSAQNTFLRF